MKRLKHFIGMHHWFHYFWVCNDELILCMFKHCVLSAQDVSKVVEKSSQTFSPSIIQTEPFFAKKQPLPSEFCV